MLGYREREFEERMKKLSQEGRMKSEAWDDGYKCGKQESEREISRLKEQIVDLTSENQRLKEEINQLRRKEEKARISSRLNPW